MPSILIVCSANMCRSPMGEAILRRMLAERSDADRWHVESAGTWAEDGNPATLFSQLVMQTKGIDISAHQSQAVDNDLVSQFDLILTMEGKHKEALQYVFKEHADRIFIISEMVGNSEDISDPIGGDFEDYKETADKLEHIFSAGLDRICQLASSSQKKRSEYGYGQVG